MTKIAVVYYSVYGHTKTLADEAVKALQGTGTEVNLFQLPETLSEEVLGKMGAAPRTADPVINHEDLPNYDGYIFVIATRYGRAVAQWSNFFDRTGGLWMQQALSKKFATIITSTGTQHGGQETTALTTMPFFAHHGIIYVPLGYKDGTITDMTEILAGSPWGSATLAGADGSRSPTVKELSVVAFHAKHFNEVVSQYVKGA
jgi:NAD(P)H dehydrogenase (quinone)